MMDLMAGEVLQPQVPEYCAFRMHGAHPVLVDTEQRIPIGIAQLDDGAPAILFEATEKAESEITSACGACENLINCNSRPGYVVYVEIYSYVFLQRFIQPAVVVFTARFEGTEPNIVHHKRADADVSVISARFLQAPVNAVTDA